MVEELGSLWTTDNLQRTDDDVPSLFTRAGNLTHAARIGWSIRQEQLGLDSHGFKGWRRKQRNV